MLDDANTFSNLQLVNEFQELSDPRQRALLGLLVICEKHDLPPSELLQSFADDLPRTPLEARRRTRGLYWSKVEEYSKVVDDTESAYDAMTAFRGLLPDYVIVAMRWRKSEADEESLSQAWLDRPPDSLFDNPRQKSFFTIALPLVIKLLFVIQIITFVMIKVVPEFKMMLEEFGVERSAILDLTIRISDTTVKFWFLPVLFMLLLLPFLLPAFRRYLGRWNPFAWQRTTSHRSVLNRQALALEIMHPGQTEKILPTKIVQSMGAEEPQTEIDWAKIKASRVINNHEAEVLATAGSGDVQAWLLRRSAGKRENRINTRGTFLTRCFATFVNIVIAIFALMLGLSVFSTLIRIMESL